MGASLLMACAVIDEHQTPDWRAAKSRIDAMTVRQFEENAVLLQQFQPELPDGEEAAAGSEPGASLDVEPMRDWLHRDLRRVRESMEQETHEISFLTARGAKVWVAGGMSWGDDPTTVYSAMKRLSIAGVLAAAGFDDDPQPAVVNDGAGCDRCGTNDRTAGSRYCASCTDSAYRVFVMRRASDMLHDTPTAARAEAFLAATESEGHAEIRGPGDYRERVEIANARERGALGVTGSDSQLRDALRMAVGTLEEHASDSDNPSAMLDAAAQLEAMLDAAASGDGLPTGAGRCPNCGGPDGYPSEHAVGCPYGHAAKPAEPKDASGAEPRGSVDIYLEVSGLWSISHLTRDWGPARRAALLAGSLHAKQALLDAAERATLDRPDDVVRTVHTVTIHAERADDPPPGAPGDRPAPESQRPAGLVMTGRCCPRCGNELGVRDDVLCVGCANEQRGRCRWCGVNPPSAGSDLCTACARSGEIAIKAGSFTAAAETEHFGAELGTLPTSTDGDTHHRLVQAKPPTVRISAEQLGDLRDGHRLWLQTDLGEPVALAHGDLTEVQIEALAAGRAVTARIEVDRELCLATIALSTGCGLTEHRPPER